MSIADLYVPAERITALTHVRLGIYGANGSGKTTFASTIPDTERVLYVSVDDENIRPVSRLKHFRVLKLRRWNDLLLIYQALSSPKSTITTLVWDTWSRIQDLALGKVCGYEPADQTKLAQYIDRIPKSPDGWKGWGQVGALCSEWQRNFNMLPIHVVYLLQQQDRRDGDDVLTGPRLTPEALKGIRDSLEIVGRLYVDLEAPGTNGHEPGEPNAQPIPMMDLLTSPQQAATHIDPDAREVRRLFIGQHERYIAKGPTHVLGRVITEPTWDKIVPPLMALSTQNG
ncbi:MAG TPA: AAA family ATPase [Chloroflexota bacterium]|nr:AAA family ATPase [Chloroflexota bacterium]